jgi:hypothetical protein
VAFEFSTLLLMGGRAESPGLIGPYGLISRSVSVFFSRRSVLDPADQERFLCPNKTTTVSHRKELYAQPNE